MSDSIGETYDEKIEYPIWIIGSSSTSNDTPKDLIDGMVRAESDGEMCFVIFLHADAANRVLDKAPNKNVLTAKSIDDPKMLDLLLEFFADAMGVKNVLVGKRDGSWFSASIVGLRFNIAMEN